MIRSTTSGLDERGVCGDPSASRRELPKSQAGELLEGTYIAEDLVPQPQRASTSVRWTKSDGQFKGCESAD